MAIAFVQASTAEAGNFDSTSVAYGSNVTSGNLLLCTGAAWNGNDITDVTVTDTRGTTYTTLMGVATGGTPNIPWLAYGVAPSSGACTVTINPNSGGAYASFTISEFSGTDATPLDVNGGNSTGASTTPSDGLTTVATNTVVIGVMTYGGGGSITPGSGWTELGEIESTSNCPYASEYQIFSSAGAKTADWSTASANSWCAMTASFKATAAAATHGHRKLLLGVGI